MVWAPAFEYRNSSGEPGEAPENYRSLATKQRESCHDVVTSGLEIMIKDDKSASIVYKMMIDNGI